MQREILFRGQRADNGEWVYGSLQHFDNGECYIKSTESNKRFGAGILINPETVGQFTGLTDKNGTKIFEGDVLAKSKTRQTQWLVYWLELSLCFTAKQQDYNIIDIDPNAGEILGWTEGHHGNHPISDLLLYEYYVVGNIHKAEGGENE